MGCCANGYSDTLISEEKDKMNDLNSFPPRERNMEKIYSDLQSIIEDLIEEENWEKLISFAYCQVKIPEKKPIFEIVLEALLDKLRKSQGEIIPQVKPLMPYFFTLIETSELAHKKLAMTYLSEILDTTDDEFAALLKKLRPMDIIVPFLAHEDREINHLAALICDLFFSENWAFKVKFCKLNGVDSLVELVRNAGSDQERHFYLKVIKNALDEQEPLCFKQISSTVNLDKIQELIKGFSDQTSIEIKYLIEYIKDNLNTRSEISPS